MSDKEFSPQKAPRKGESFQASCQEKIRKAVIKSDAIDGLYQSLDEFFNSWSLEKEQLSDVKKYISQRNKPIK